MAGHQRKAGSDGHVRGQTQDISALRMGIFAPAHGAYHATCQVVAQVGRTGAAETRRIGDLLDAIATVYEREEEVNAATAQSIHQQYGKW